MKVILISALMACLSLYAVADCENSMLVIHTKGGESIKVYVDGMTGTNPATPGVTVNGVTPGEHVLKVVAVTTDANGYVQRRTVFSGTINVRTSRYMDAWVEEGKGISIHETKEPCDGIPDPNAPAPTSDNGGKTYDNNTAVPQPAGNSQPNESQMPAYSGQPNNGQAPDNSNNQAPPPPAQPAPPVGNSFAAPTQSGSIASSAEKGDEYRNTASTEHLPAHISDDDFEQLKSAIGQVQYETKKIDTLKSLISGKRFATSQVSQLMDLFAFESDKLDVAKLLYDRTVDKYNYGRLASNFNFDARKEDFKKFMAGK